MRISAFVVLTLATMAALAPRQATAAYNYPWCAFLSDSSTYSCAFRSIEECWATVRGIGGFCRPNFHNGPYPPAAEPRRAKRHDSGYH
jgi:Protein of unknown function (DUF3551)